jgi:hypothetical protein
MLYVGRNTYVLYVCMYYTYIRTYVCIIRMYVLYIHSCARTYSIYVRGKDAKVYNVFIVFL